MIHNSVAKASTNATEKDIEQIDRLTTRWVNLWSPKDKKFTGEGFKDIFATGEKDIVVFDNFGGTVVIMHSLQEYLETWVPVMQEMTYWAIALEDNLEISIDGNLAVTTFSFSGGGKTKDGQTIKIRQHGTHTWKRLNGQWRLVHEHLTIVNPPEN